MSDGFDDYLKEIGYSDEQVAAARADDSPSERAESTIERRIRVYGDTPAERLLRLTDDADACSVHEGGRRLPDAPGRCDRYDYTRLCEWNDADAADDCGEGPGCPFHGDGSTPGVVVEVPALTELERFALMDHRAGEHSEPTRNVTHCRLCREIVRRMPATTGGKGEK